MEQQRSQNESDATTLTDEEVIAMAESGTNIREAGIDEAEMSPEPPAEDAQA